MFFLDLHTTSFSSYRRCPSLPPLWIPRRPTQWQPKVTLPLPLFIEIVPTASICSHKRGWWGFDAAFKQTQTGECGVGGAVIVLWDNVHVCIYECVDAACNGSDHGFLEQQSETLTAAFRPWHWGHFVLLQRLNVDFILRRHEETSKLFILAATVQKDSFLWMQESLQGRSQHVRCFTFLSTVGKVSRNK